MKANKKKAAAVLLGVLLLAGCQNREQIYLETAEESTEYGTEKEEKTTEIQSGGELSDEDAGLVYVYVCGEVVHPAVYEVAAGTRICEVIALAGGLTPEAAAEAVNQAEPVADGMMIRIPGILEFEQMPQEKETGASADGRLDLNTATVQELMTLPGIGEAKAKSIAAYREKTGGFSAVEDIMNVEGIKEGVYNRIKDSVTVR